MAVSVALRATVRTLRREPALVPLVFVVNLPLVYLNQLDLLLGPGAEWVGRILSILVSPLVLGALFGVLDEVTDGERLRLGRLPTHAARNYPSLLGANLVALAGLVGGAILLAVLAVIPVVNVVAVLAAIPLAVVAAMVLQFVNVLVVVVDETATSVFEESYRRVVDTAADVFVYSLLRLVLAVAAVAPTLWSLFAAAPTLEAVDAATVGPRGFALMTLGGLVSVLLLPLHVHYVKQLGVGGDDAEPAASAPAPGPNPATRL